jgi:hypothetical protein
MSLPAATKKVTLKKIQRRLLQWVYRYVPYNTAYRPKGVYDTALGYINAQLTPRGEYVEIYPEHVTQLRTSPAFKKALSPYTIYDEWAAEDPLTLKAKTDYFAVRVPNARLYTNNISLISIIADDDMLLGDISLQYISARDSTVRGNESPILKQRYFVHPKKYRGTVFSMLPGGAATFNYGHWLIDVIPRIHLLKQSGWYEKVDYFLVPSYRKDYEIDTLKLLGIDASKIIESNEQLHIQADAIIASSHPRGERSYLIPRWVINYLNEAYLTDDILRNDLDFPPLIYISRSDSGLRRVTNEGEVMNMLSQYGFKTFVLSQLSFTDKVNLFYNAKVIVAASGAGLSNILFSRPGTKLVEIFSEGYVQSFFYNIANFKDLEHHLLVCKSPSPARNMKEGLTEDITIELDKLKPILDTIL